MRGPAAGESREGGRSSRSRGGDPAAERFASALSAPLSPQANVRNKRRLALMNEGASCCIEVSGRRGALKIACDRASARAAPSASASAAAAKSDARASKSGGGGGRASAAFFASGSSTSGGAAPRDGAEPAT